MVTVLMATYQGKQYLEQQLDTILAQTVPVKILISDDGSDDGTRAMLENYAGWYPEQVFLHHRTEHTGGAAGNFFWLMQEALKDEKNEYIFFSDQDDVWENNKVSVMLHRMKVLEKGLGKQCPILLYSDMEVVDEELYEISPSFAAYTHQDPDRNSFAELLVENQVTGGASMINRALLARCAKKPEICCMHDWWMALTASCFGVIEFMPRTLSKYRQHGDNVLGAKDAGSFGEMKARLGRGKEVEQNYRRMLNQGIAFGRRFWKDMDKAQRMTLRAFLALPYQSAAGRLKNIRYNHFYKNSALQTLAMCVTLPRAEKLRQPKGEQAAEGETCEGKASATERGAGKAAEQEQEA